MFCPGQEQTSTRNYPSPYNGKPSAEFLLTSGLVIRTASRIPGGPNESATNVPTPSIKKPEFPLQSKISSIIAEKSALFSSILRPPQVSSGVHEPSVSTQRQASSVLAGCPISQLDKSVLKSY